MPRTGGGRARDGARTVLRALVARPVPVRPAVRAARWRLVGPATGPFPHHLRSEPYPVSGPDAAVVLLGDVWTDEAVATLLAGERFRAARLVLVHSGAGGGSLLRGLAAEAGGTPVVAIELAAQTPAALATAGRLLGAPPYPDDLTVHADGTVTTPAWHDLELPAAAPALRGEVVLVTGGLGGLGVRVAVGLAAAGARPVLVDRRRCDEVPADVARHLTLLHRLAPTARTVTLDLTSGAAAARLAHLSPRAVVHCAGRIAGGTGRTLGDTEIRGLVSAKVDTLRQVVSAVRTDRLRAVLAFGSVTAHGAHPGLAGYALANELLRREMAAQSRRYPVARWCTAEWSVWSGAGMARQVARVAARRLGMVPVPVATGVSATVRLVCALVAGAGELPDALLIAGAHPGTEGRWAGRPEGLPGVYAAQLAPPGSDLDSTVRTVAEAAAGHRPLRPEQRAGSGAPLLVRAEVRGDRVHCEVSTGGPARVALRREQFRIVDGVPGPAPQTARSVI